MAEERSYAHRSLMDKLGVKPGSRVSVLGIRDDGFAEQLHDRGADVSTGRRRDSDLIFMLAETNRDLGRLNAVEPHLGREGALWVVYQRGRKDLREVDVIAAGLGAGLVDNKVVRFSDTHTALRFVVPVGRR